MTNKNIIISVIVIAAVVLGGGALYMYSQQIAGPATQTYNPKTQGKVIFGIKDAATSMGAVSSVVITVNKIQLHGQNLGWVTVSEQIKQYDLLVLRDSGATALLANANVQAGTYDQMLLTVSKVVVTENGNQVEAKLPSGQLTIVGNIIVNADKTSTAVIDFFTDKSLHATGNGAFIFTPVLHAQTQSDAKADIDSDQKITISAGHMDSDSDQGMDIDGHMKDKFMLDGKVKLNVENDVVRQDTENDGDASVKITSTTAIATAISSGSLDSVISVTLMQKNDAKVWVVNGLKNLELTTVYVSATTGVMVTN